MIAHGVSSSARSEPARRDSARPRRRRP
jgi:hypothetical protein